VFHVKHEGPGQPSNDPIEALGAELDPSAWDRLRAYEELLVEIAIPRGMVAAGDRDRLFERHIADSLRAVALLGTATEVVDLGSGAGLPGVPIAAALPLVHVVLAESRQTRAAFLDLVRDSLPLPNVEVVHAPVAQIPSTFEVCLARAFGSPARSWEAATRLLGPGGRLLYWAGRSFRAQDVPEGVPFEVVATSALANAGPIVIMTRQ
jgi:16S rRNA (guanine527-N7)-methyltransferase